MLLMAREFAANVVVLHHPLRSVVSEIPVAIATAPLPRPAVLQTNTVVTERAPNAVPIAIALTATPAAAITPVFAGAESRAPAALPVSVARAVLMPRSASVTPEAKPAVPVLRRATMAVAVSQTLAPAQVTPSAVQGSATNPVANACPAFRAVTGPVMATMTVARATPAAAGPAVIPLTTPASMEGAAQLARYVTVALPAVPRGRYAPVTRVVQLRRCAAVSAVLRSAAAISAVLRAMSVMKGAAAIAARQLTYVV